MNPPFFLRIFRRDSDGSLTGETADGSLHPLPRIDEDDLAEGDVLRIYDDRWDRADSENWVPRYRVGIVRVVDGSRAIVDAENRVLDTANLSGQDLAPGNTVRIDARNSITDVISAEPIPPAPIQIDRDEDFDVELLISDTSEATLDWTNFGGLPDLVERAQELVEVHLRQRHAYAALGATPLRGVIFEGPPGTGKTFLARIMAHKAEATLYVVGAPELGGRLVGESEGRLQKLYDHAAKQKQSIIFIDELDSISHQRGESGGSHSDRLVSTFLVNMDGFKAKDNVLTIGTTNRLQDIDRALRRPGRFGTEFKFRQPNLPDRVSILQARAKIMQTAGDLAHELVAGETEGWSPAELDEIWTQAATEAIRSGSPVITEVNYIVGFEQLLRLRLDRERER